MNRLSIALCLSTSVVALVVAGFALLESRSDGTEARGSHEQDLHELQTLLSSLQNEVHELKAEQGTLMRRSFGPPVARTKAGAKTAKSPAAEPDRPGDLEEQVAVLAERLASLEDEENIARLARSGSRQVAKKEIRNALYRVGDPEAAPEERLAALERLRSAGKSNREMMQSLMAENEMRERDLYIPMLELAQDTTLDPAFRAEVLRNFHGTEVEELRQPMLDLFASGDVSEVRVEALTSLFWHIGDATVRETIREAAQRDSDEAVQARATRILPKVEHMERAAADAQSTADGGDKR